MSTGGTPPKRYVLDGLRIEPSLISETVRAIIHTIILHRAFGVISPTTYTEGPGLAYVGVGVASVEGAVSRIARAAAEEAGPVTLAVSINESVTSKGWFSKGKEYRVWEGWSLALSPASGGDGIDGVRDRIQLIIRAVNTDRGHIPPIASQVLFPFPITIALLRPDTGSVLAQEDLAEDGAASAGSTPWNQWWGLLTSPTKSLR